MTIKTQLLILTITALLSFAYGRHTVTIPTFTEKTQSETDTHRTTVEHRETIRQTDGTIQTTVDTTTNVVKNESTARVHTQEPNRSAPVYNLSLMASYNLVENRPDLGISIGKKVDLLVPTRLSLGYFKSGNWLISAGWDF